MSHKLTPIYDAFDSGDFKNALKLCNILLKREKKGIFMIKSLKAISLSRLNYTNEAQLLCEECIRDKSSIPRDEETLSTFATACKDSFCLDFAVSAIESHCESIPSLQRLLLNVYIKNNSYLKAQHLSLKFYKSTGNVQWYFWSIMNMIMQGEKLIILAEKLLYKAMSDGLMCTVEHFQMLVSCLIIQNKLQDAYDVLSTPPRSIVITEPEQFELNRIKCSLLRPLKMYRIGLIEYTKLIVNNNMDDWSFYVGLLECSLSINIDDDINELCTRFSNLYLHNYKSLMISNPTECVSVFIEHLQQSCSTLRGPFLAQLQLLKLTGNFSNIDDLIISFCSRFGHKPCCGDDLKPFIPLVNNKEAFIIKLESIILTEDIKLLRTVKDIRCYVTFLNIKRMSGGFFKQSNDDMEVIINQLIKHYFQVLPLSSNIESSERVVGDDILFHAVWLLMDLYYGNRNYKYLFRSVSLLEIGLSKSQHNFDFRIYLLKLYSLLGDIGSVRTHFQKLQVKNVQYYSLSYLILPCCCHLFDSGQGTLISKILSIHDDCQRSLPDSILSCYEAENFSKIIEFKKFGESLKSSYLSYSCRLSAWFLQLRDHVKTLTSVDLSVSTFVYETCSAIINACNDTKLTFHNDYKVCVDFEMVDDDFMLNQKRQDLEQCQVDETNVIKLRAVTLLYIYNITKFSVALTHSSNFVNHNIENNIYISLIKMLRSEMIMEMYKSCFCIFENLHQLLQQTSEVVNDSEMMKFSVDYVRNFISILVLFAGNNITGIGNGNVVTAMSNLAIGINDLLVGIVYALSCVCINVRSSRSNKKNKKKSSPINDILLSLTHIIIDGCDNIKTSLYKTCEDCIVSCVSKDDTTLFVEDEENQRFKIVKESFPDLMRLAVERITIILDMCKSSLTQLQS